MSEVEKRVKVLEKYKEGSIKFYAETHLNIKNIFRDLADIKNNHLRHIDRKITTLLFSVLFVILGAIIGAVIKWVMGS